MKAKETAVVLIEFQNDFCSEQKIFPLIGQTLSVDQFISQLEE